MTAFILTWNPARTEITQVEYDRYVKKTAAGRELNLRWSVGTRTDRFASGDSVFLLRVVSERGIVASGYITKAVEHEAHWEDRSRYANYVYGMWTAWVSSDDRLPLEILTRKVPAVKWHRLQRSGTQVPADAAAKLDRLWESHLRNLGRKPYRPAFQEIAEEVLPSRAIPRARSAVFR